MAIRRTTLVLVLVAAVPSIGSATGAQASFVGSTPGAAGSVSTATIAPPTSVTAARGTCVLLTSATVVVSWTATSSTFADGYEILRSTTSGSGYSSIGTVAGLGTTTFTDGTVAFLTTYYYVVRAKKLAWRSVNSNQAQVTTPSPVCV
jgi:hypothetical protein